MILISNKRQRSYMVQLSSISHLIKVVLYAKEFCSVRLFLIVAHYSITLIPNAEKIIFIYIPENPFFKFLHENETLKEIIFLNY